MIVPPSQKRLSLNELPRWSNWLGRFLGVGPLSPIRRTREKIDAEYDKDKYASCLAYYRQHAQEGITVDQVRKEWEMRAVGSESCVSFGDELFLLSSSESLTMNDQLLLEVLGPLAAQADSVVELGCGYGHNLWLLAQQFPGKTFFGGEYSPQAVTLAQELYRNNPSIHVEQFNFYDPTYPILDRLEKGRRVLVFTRHAIEQLPSAANVCLVLPKYADRMTAVVHLEPLYETHGESLLALLRKRYTEMNDYNRDLLPLLRANPAVTVQEAQMNVFGLNPLNPTSVIRWICAPHG
ncbi:MAG: class I SAM-dependent methyltransferase [Candidatus Peribacteraceae bacterium]|nr:class I SAM-dependent methyltransferase [Candidatus Peribacteraceae bacterium]MDD5740298.1 class I SAM-dependent methyltransferase [Candidatus Peribacteraceae bacterium]